MIEEELQKAMFQRNNEKTFIDKLLAKNDIDAVRDIIKKKELTREDILELLYLLTSTEAKLVNYSPWDRYVILKFFVWIREFTKVAELLYDYKDQLEILKKKNPDVLPERTLKLLLNSEKLIQHNTKFLVDLYFNIARTTLSIGATGILELLKNKFEVNYGTQPQVTQQRSGWFGKKQEVYR